MKHFFHKASSQARQFAILHSRMQRFIQCFSVFPVFFSVFSVSSVFALSFFSFSFFFHVHTSSFRPDNEELDLLSEKMNDFFRKKSNKYSGTRTLAAQNISLDREHHPTLLYFPIYLSPCFSNLACAMMNFRT